MNGDDWWEFIIPSFVDVSGYLLHSSCASSGTFCHHCLSCQFVSECSHLTGHPDDWLGEVVVGLCDVSGFCECFRFVWMFQVCVNVSGLCGFFKFRYMFQVCMNVSSLCEYLMFMWISQVCVNVSGLCECFRFVWIFQVWVYVSGLCECFRFVWIFQVCVNVSGLCEHLSSLF